MRKASAAALIGGLVAVVALVSSAPLGTALQAPDGVAAGAATEDDSWVQWRGPRRDGAAPGFALPERLPEQPRRAWEVEVGVGHSSPVTLDDRAWVHTREGDLEVVRAIDLADGRIRWQSSYAAPYRMDPAARGHGPGPKSTPVLAGGRLFTFGIGGILSAFDADSGELLWRRHFTERYATTSPVYGTAMSPLVEDDRLIVHVGGAGDGALTAFEPASGAPIWSFDEHGPGYSSPIVVALAGRRQVVTQTEGYVVGLAFADGELLWSLPLRVDFDQNIVTPVVWRDLLVVSGLDRGVFAVRLEAEGRRLRSREVWRNDELPMYMSSPVLAGGRLLGFSHRRSGQFFALDPATGEAHWTSLGRDGENASLVVAGDRVLALTDGGELLVLDAGAAEFSPLARWRVATSPTWAHPVPTDRGLLIKDLQSLALWAF